MVHYTLGFIGTGGITSFMVRGLCSAPEFTGRIILSVHKHVEKPNELRALAPKRISLSHLNQEIVDAADIVFIAVLPNQHEQVVSALHFREGQRIIQITGGVKLSDAMHLYKPATAARAIPLPFAARRKGPILLYGGDNACREVMSLMGSIVDVKSEEEFAVLGPVTGMMVPYYALLAEYVKWGIARGLSFRTVLDYAAYMNEALSSFMRTDCTEDTEKFLRDNSTPGGVNELGLKLMREYGAYELWSKTLDALYDKYNSMGKSN